jgi:hypothetical protein
MAPSPMRIALAAGGACLALALGACGGDDGDDLVDESELRECLAGSELEVQPPGRTGGGAALGNASPDFVAVTPGGVEVDFIVQGDERKAQRSAADVRAALARFAAASSEVLRDRNAIAVIAGEASEEDRAAIEDCLGV